jgi:predicted DNA repair protein MutK
MAGFFFKSKNITMCPDGKYRWVYELDMYKSSAIIKEVWRVFLISGTIVIAFVFAMNIMDNGLMEALQFVAQTAAILFGIFLVLSIIGYLVFAFIIGGKYCVVFEMDEDGINHKQHQKHVKKAELIGAITALAGIAGGNLSTVGTGVLAAARTSMYTGFDDVKELEFLPKDHLIRVNETLSRNQVYAEEEDFAFVANYLKEHCRNAKVKE